MTGGTVLSAAGQELLKTGRRLHYYVKFFFFLLGLALVATLYMPVLLMHPWGTKQGWIASRPIRKLSKLLGVNWQVRGQENIVQDSGCVILINHQTVLDTLALFELYPLMDGIRCVARREVLCLFPCAQAALTAGTIYINRSNPKTARAALNQTEQLIRVQKTRLLLFPEGTRNDSGNLLPFKKGGFHVAISSQRPIQPIVISQYPFLDAKTHTFGSGSALIEILPPIPTAGLTKEDINQLVEKTHSIMQEAYQRLSKEAAASCETKVKESGVHNEENGTKIV